MSHCMYGWDFQLLKSVMNLSFIPISNFLLLLYYSSFQQIGRFMPWMLQDCNIIWQSTMLKYLNLFFFTGGWQTTDGWSKRVSTDNGSLHCDHATGLPHGMTRHGSIELFAGSNAWSTCRCLLMRALRIVRTEGKGRLLAIHWLPYVRYVETLLSTRPYLSNMTEKLKIS